MNNHVYCPHCYKENVDFTTVIGETSIVLDDGVEYRYIAQTAICCECGKPCINEEYRQHNAIEFNNVVRVAHSCIPQWQIDELFNRYGETLRSISEKLNISPELVKNLKNGICPSREHSDILKTIWLAHALAEEKEIPLIGEIRSGGQTGVDRAAFDAAREVGLPICGWCPKGGWAEDMEDAPGLLIEYPEMVETPEEKPEQRTMWNVRDADAVIIYYHESKNRMSVGTELAKDTGLKHNKLMLIADCHTKPEDVIVWLKHIGRDLTLSIGGPRESESPGIYDEAKNFFHTLFLIAKN